jgi:DNA-binding LacI/PurR family transcriptional regulator
MRVSTHDLAREAGVHQTTVSRALRNDRGVSEEVRQRILKLAEKRGYLPDPMLSALVYHRTEKSAPKYQATLGWINNYRQPNQLLQDHPMYWEGAQTRAQALGYKLEEFRLADCKWETPVLSKILRARNIKGLLLAPQQRGRTHLKMDWENFSVVTLGFTLVHPQFHVVTTAQYRCGVLVMRSLRALGYRRIGCALTRNYDERTDHNFSASFLREQWRFHRNEAVPLYIGDAHESPKQERLFAKWYRKHRPDVIVTHYSAIASWLEALNNGKKKCPLVYLGVNAVELDKAGIIQNESLVGRTAVETLVAMLHRNECGVPATPLRILVEGKWINSGEVPRFP